MMHAFILMKTPPTMYSSVYELIPNSGLPGCDNECDSCHYVPATQDECYRF